MNGPERAGLYKLSLINGLPLGHNASGPGPEI